MTDCRSPGSPCEPEALNGCSFGCCHLDDRATCIDQLESTKQIQTTLRNSLKTARQTNFRGQPR